MYNLGEGGFGNICWNCSIANIWEVPLIFLWMVSLKKGDNSRWFDVSYVYGAHITPWDLWGFVNVNFDFQYFTLSHFFISIIMSGPLDGKMLATSIAVPMCFASYERCSQDGNNN